MPSLFQPQDRQEILNRIQKLNPDAIAEWGKMDVKKMLRHCQAPLQVALGELKLKQGLIGLLFGKMAKKSLLKPEPFKRDLPTAPQFKVGDIPLEFENEKQKLISLIKQFGEAGPQNDRGKHPFFGTMNENEWDQLQWKHLDHHLRQFGG